MSEEVVRWRVDEAANAATLVRELPLHAFWTLLAPSFRWVLLPPQRRAGGEEITWEWQSPAPPRTPEAADLEDIRLRLRDGLDLLEEELQRHPALPERLSADELVDAMKEALQELRFGSDDTLAAFAVHTTRGWMLRSWGFATPSPAQAEGDAAEGRSDSPATLPARLAPPRKGKPVRRILARRLRAGALGAVLALALAALAPRCAHSRVEENTPADPGPAADALAPTAATPPAAQAASPTKTQAEPISSAGGQPGNTLGASSAPSVSPSSAPLGLPPSAHPTEAVSSLPLAITGSMASMPNEQGAPAAPPSKLAGKPEAPPPPAIFDSNTDSGGAPASDTVSKLATAPESQKNGPPDTSDASAATPGLAQERVLTPERSAGVSGTTPPAAMPKPFSVEAREASEPPARPTPQTNRRNLAASPATATDASSESVFPTVPPEREVNPSGNSGATEFGAAVRVSGRNGFVPADVAPEPPPRRDTAAAADATIEGADDLRLFFSGRPMPWRLVLERDAPLPTRPSEGNGEEEMRAARIAAWAKARTLLPPIFRTREIRVGWSFSIAPEASAKPPFSWRDVRTGETLADTLATTSNDTARIGWRDVDTTDVDALLIDKEGRALARVRRVVAENRSEIRKSAALADARPWFSLRILEGDDAAGITAPAGWGLQRINDELVADGPAEASRFRWEHPASGWVLHGGYSRDTR